MRLIYHPDAELELIDAARFYEGRVPTLGSQFLDAADQGVRLIQSAPERFRVIEGGGQAIDSESFSLFHLLSTFARRNPASRFHPSEPSPGLLALPAFGIGWVHIGRNPLALGEMSGQSAAHQGGLAELVDALDSKSSSNECGFESHSRYFSLTATAGSSPTHAAWHLPSRVPGPLESSPAAVFIRRRSSGRRGGNRRESGW